MDCYSGDCSSSTASSNSTHIRNWPPFHERFRDFPEALSNEMVRASLNVLKNYMDKIVECIFGNNNGFCTPSTNELSWVMETARKAGVDVGKYEVLLMQVREEEERLRSARIRIYSQFHGSQVRVDDDKEEDEDNDYLIQFFE